MENSQEIKTLKIKRFQHERKVLQKFTKINQKNIVFIYALNPPW